MRDGHLVQGAPVPEPAVFSDIQDGEAGSESASGEPVRSADASTLIGIRTNPAGFLEYLARTGAGEGVGEGDTDDQAAASDIRFRGRDPAGRVAGPPGR